MLGLDDWHTTLGWQVKNKDAFAHTYVSTEYQDMQLAFDLDKLAQKSDTFIEEVVVHELLHAIVGTLPALPAKTPRKLVTWFEENTVTKLSAAFMRLRQACSNDKAKA